MNRNDGRRRGPPLRLLLPLGMASIAAPVVAQSPASEPPVRVGPEATGPQLPDYARPTDVPSLTPPPPTASPSPAVTADASVRQFDRVEVVADSSHSAPLPPPGWTVPAAPGVAPAVLHTPGERLDARWVERQFARSLASGGLAASTAIGLVQAINRAFVGAGFINSGLLVDPASTDSSTLRLRLVYGRLAAAGEGHPVDVAWNQDRSDGLGADYVRARFPSAQGQPLSAIAIERDFRLMTEDPAIRSISAALRPGDQPGTAALQLLVRPAPRFDLQLRAANDRSPSVGGEQIGVSASVRHSLTDGDLLGVDASLTGGSESVQLAYSTPFFSPGTSLVLRGGINRAAVIDRPLVPLDIRTRERSAEIGLVQTLIRDPLSPRGLTAGWRPSRTVNVGLFGVYRRQRSYLLGEPFSFAPGSVDGRTEYKAARLTADLSQRNTNYVAVLSLTATMGLGGTQSDIPSIANPRDHFSAFLGQAAFARRLNASGLELRGRLTGQYTGGTLYSSERLSVGGANSVRGYRESLYLVDRGLIGSIELAYPFTLGGKGRGSSLTSFIASIFGDAATFRNDRDPQPSVETIGSIGATLSWTPSPAFRATVTYGHALTNVPLPQTRDLQDRGIHFRITVNPAGLF